VFGRGVTFGGAGPLDGHLAFRDGEVSLAPSNFEAPDEYDGDVEVTHAAGRHAMACGSGKCGSGDDSSMSPPSGEPMPAPSPAMAAAAPTSPPGRPSMEEPSLEGTGEDAGVYYSEDLQEKLGDLEGQYANAAFDHEGAMADLRGRALSLESRRGHAKRIAIADAPFASSILPRPLPPPYTPGEIGFPFLGLSRKPATPPEDPAWDALVLETLRALDRRPAMAALAGGVRVTA
jgi:hypothetical protein